jgi:hypothetical protein
MPKRSSNNEDANEAAARIVEMITLEREGKNPYAVALGRLGGKKGGKARAEKLSPARRKQIARKAAQTRWKRRQG